MSSTGKLTWIHVSDLHFGHGDPQYRFDQAGVTDAIIRNAADMARRLGPPDLIFVTGDVAFSGQPEQYAQARAFLERLLLAVGGKQRIFIVPGNHDIDRKLAANFASAAVHRALRADPSKLDDLLLFPIQMETIWPKLRAYAEFAKNFSGPAISWETPFYIQEISCALGGKLIVVGLNTALLCFDGDDSPANLRLGRGQILKAIEQPPRDTLLLVLQHHPQAWLLDGNELDAHLQQRPHILFSGHVHRQQGILQAPLLGGSQLQFVAGAGHQDKNEEGHHAYAWGQLTEEGLAYYSSFWHPERKAFTLETMLETDDFKRSDHAFVERARLPRSIQNWLPAVVPAETSPHAASLLPQAVEPPPATTASSFSPDNADYYIPYRAKGSQLVGRKDTLDEMVRKFDAPGKHPGRVALFGIGGLGKTQVAVEYCHQRRERYGGGIYWLDAAEDLDGQLSRLCDRAKWLSPDSQPDEKLAAARQRLRSHKNSLLVFDNVEDPASIKSYLPEESNDSHVLVIGRSERLIWQTVQLRLLSIEDSMRLLEVESGRTLESPSDKHSASSIAKQLDGLPLALELVGAFLKRRHQTGWADCAADLERRGMRAKSLVWSGFEDESLTRHGADLHAALSLDEPLFASSPMLRRVLDILAWTGPAPIGEGLLSELLGKPDPADLLDALDVSAQLRILSIEQEVSGARRIRIHRLVQQVRRQDVARPQGEELQQLIKRLTNWFERERMEFASLSTYEAELPHLRTYQEYARQASFWPTLVRLRWLEAYPPYHRGEYKVARSVVEDAIKLYEEHRVDDLILLAHLQNDLGSTCAGLGLLRESLASHLESLSIRRRELGDKNTDTAMSLLNLSRAYWIRGQFEDAINLARQALAIWRDVLGEDRSETARALSALGAFLGGIGKYSEGIELLEQSLRLWRQIHGDRHPETARALSLLSAVYHDQKQVKEGKQYREQVLAICLEVLGDKHPQTAHALSDLGGSYLSLGRSDESLKFHQQSLDILREIFGEMHPTTGAAFVDLGDSYEAQGRLNEALAVKQRGFDIYHTMNGDNPDTIRIRNSLGKTHFALGQYTSALGQHRAAYEHALNVLGRVHSDTLNAVGHVAKDWAALKQRGEALKFLRQGMRDIPASHPAYPGLKQLESQLMDTGGMLLQKGWRQPPNAGGKRGKKPKRR